MAATFPSTRSANLGTLVTLVWLQLSKLGKLRHKHFPLCRVHVVALRPVCPDRCWATQVSDLRSGVEKSREVGMGTSILMGLKRLM